MLPSPDGYTFVGTINPGETIGTYTASWNITDVYNPANLVAVVYTQDEETKKIYQAATIPLVGKTNVVTGVERQFLDGADFALHPNPANDIVNITFDRPINEPIEFELIDQTGKVLIKGTASVGEEQVAIDTELLPQGMYFINVYNENIQLKPRRLIVTHQ
jgi:hypothetical protein